MRNWTFMQWVIAIIVFCGAVAILFVALPAMGIMLPTWFIQICMIVIVCVVAIAAIGLLVKLWNGWGGGPP